ncbi:ABC transporter permease [Guggenheimella bovis]
MKWWSIAKKEFLHLLYAPESILLMILFPIALTLVLGLSLESVMSGTVELEETEVQIVREENFLTDMYKEAGKEAKLKFIDKDEKEIAKGIEEGKITNYVEYKDNEIVVHSNGSSLNSIVIDMYSKAFAGNVNLANYLQKNNRLDLMPRELNKVTTVEGIENKARPKSMDYFGITMLTLIIMYGSFQSLSSFEGEIYRGTLRRIKVSPVNLGTVFVGKMIAVTIVTLIQATIVILVNKFLFHVNYGNLLQCYLGLVPFVLFATALGAFLFLLVGGKEFISGLLNIVIVVFVFLGGGYMALPDEGFLGLMKVHSPVGMINTGLMNSIHAGNNEILYQGASINLGLAALMIIVSFLLFTKGDSEIYVGNH